MTEFNLTQMLFDEALRLHRVITDGEKARKRGDALEVAIASIAANHYKDNLAILWRNRPQKRKSVAVGKSEGYDVTITKTGRTSFQINAEKETTP